MITFIYTAVTSKAYSSLHILFKVNILFYQKFRGHDRDVDIHVISDGGVLRSQCLVVLCLKNDDPVPTFL